MDVNRIPLAAREVVVVVDEADPGSLGVVVGRSISVDGVEMLLPSDSKITAQVGATEGLTVTVTFFASTVRFAPA